MSGIRICLNCQSPIQGRADKKFCDDACRSSHFHRHSQEDLFIMSRIHAILRRNRKIIMRLLNPGENKSSIPKKQLLEHGFIFDYHTQTIPDGNHYLFACYEYAYQELNEKEVMLLKIS